MISAAAVGAGLLIAAPTIYDAVVRAEGRTGAPAPSAPRANELQVDPAVSVATGLGDVQVLAGYNPRLLQAAGRLDLLHRERLAGDWRLSRAQHVLLEQQLTYGSFDFSPLGTSAVGSTLDPRLPPVRFVNFFSSTTSVGFEQAISRRLRVGVSGAYLISGGADAQARAYLPLQHGVLVSTRAFWILTRRDSLTLLATGTRSRFSNGTEGQLASATVSWQRELSRSTQADLSLGLGLGRTLGASRDLARTQVSPAAGAGIRHRIAELHMIGAARLLLGATIDRLSGAVYERAEGSASLEYTPNRQLRMSLLAGHSRALNGPAQGASVTRAEVGASLALGPHLGLGAGVRAAWQSFGSGSAQQGPAWVAALSMTISDHGRL